MAFSSFVICAIKACTRAAMGPGASHGRGPANGAAAGAACTRAAMGPGASHGRGPANGAAAGAPPAKVTAAASKAVKRSMAINREADTLLHCYTSLLYLTGHY